MDWPRILSDVNPESVFPSLLPKYNGVIPNVPSKLRTGTQLPLDRCAEAIQAYAEKHKIKFRSTF